MTSSLRLHCAPALPGPAALGVPDARALLDEEPAVAAAGVVEESAPGYLRLSFPLPGTPWALAHEGEGPARRGRAPGRPSGAGTGWVVLERWSPAPLGRLLRARFTHPRSASLAERRWNLSCHLRAHGVGTPEPLLVGAESSGLVSRRSFLVTRALADFEPLSEWLSVAAGAERERGLEALAASCAKLVHAGVELSSVRAGGFRVRSGRAGDDDHGSNGHACGDEPAAGGLRRNRWPGVVLADLGGLRLLRRPDALRVEDLARSFVALASELAGELSAREALRLFLAALRSERPASVSVAAPRGLATPAGPPR